MEDQLSGLGISAAIIVEALAEMPSPSGFSPKSIRYFPWEAELASAIW